MRAVLLLCLFSLSLGSPVADEAEEVMSAEDLTNLLSNLFNERDGREVEVYEDQEEGLVASEEDEAAKAMDNEVEAATAEVEVRETDPAEILKFNSYVDAVLRRMNAGIRAKRMDPMVINLGGKKKKHADSKKQKGHRTKRALTIPMNLEELEDEDDEMVAVEEEDEDEEGRSLKEDEDQEEGRKKKNRKNGKGKKKEAEDEDEDEEVDEVEGRAKKGKKNRKNKNAAGKKKDKKSKLTAEQKAAKAAKKANKKSAKKDARKGDKKKKNNAGKKGAKKNHNNKKENNNKVAATRAAKQHHNNHKNNKNNKGKSKSSKSSSSSGLGEGKVHGSLSGIATLRRAGDVEIYNIGSDQKKLKTEFTVGPLQLQVSKTHGHGSSRSEKTAKATTQNLEGKMVIKVKADGKAFVKSVFFKPPEKVNVKGSLVPQRARSDAFLKRSINLVRPLAAQRLLKIARFTMKTPATTRA